MTHQGIEAQRSGAWGQGASFLLASCGAVATATYLGAEWLRSDLAGLPVGVWTVGIAQAAGYAWHRRSLWTREVKAKLRAAPGLPVSRRNLQDIDVRLLLTRGVAAGIDALEYVAARMPWPVQALPDTTNLSRKLDGIAWLATPLRIGLDVSADTARALTAQESNHAVEWIPVPSGSDDQSVIRSYRLDALARHDCAEALHIIVAEREGHESNWFDWAVPRPLSYAAVFPAQIDPSQVTIDAVDMNKPGEARIVSLLIRTAAVLARSPHRLDLCDRLRGRRSALGIRFGPRAVSSFWPAEEFLIELSSAVVEGSSEGWTSPAWRAAARVASAWVASTDAPLDVESRKRCADACARVLPEEPEVLLRAAALRFATSDDSAAFDTLARADRVIRGRTSVDPPDQLPFLQSELEMGLPGPLTVGRVAAGICLSCATSAVERFPHIRGDVLDDMRYSAWLVGRDQDRAVLVKVFKVLEQERIGAAKSEPVSLPKAA
jgi:hypothetical protein